MSIGPDDVTLRHKDGETTTVANDFVLAMSEAMHREPERFEQDAPDDAGIAWMPGFLPSGPCIAFPATPLASRFVHSSKRRTPRACRSPSINPMSFSKLSPGSTPRHGARLPATKG